LKAIEQEMEKPHLFKKIAFKN